MFFNLLSFRCGWRFLLLRFLLQNSAKSTEVTVDFVKLALSVPYSGYDNCWLGFVSWAPDLGYVPYNLGQVWLSRWAFRWLIGTFVVRQTTTTTSMATATSLVRFSTTEELWAWATEMVTSELALGKIGPGVLWKHRRSDYIFAFLFDALGRNMSLSSTKI